MDRTTYFEKLVGSVTRIARHAYYPGKEEAIEICLGEIEDLADAGRISTVQLAALRDLLLGEEGFCMPEGVIRERECCEREFGDDRIAIICQGAGSQAAFSAGVLQGLLHPGDAGRPVVGLGGTGFGSVCAALAWDGLLRGDSIRAVDRLELFWHDYEAASTIDALANYSSQMLLHLRAIVPLGEPGLGGYSALGLDQLRRLLKRHVEFDTDRCMASRQNAVALAISSINAAGEIRVVQGPAITAEAVAATADGLFFNQPCGGPRTTTAVAPSRPCSTIQAVAAAKPSEIWLIQITKTGRGRSRGPCGDLPSFVEQIESQVLEREIAYVQSVNRMLKSGLLTEGRGYRHIEVHRIIMEHDLDDASKLDRSPGFIGGLMSYGRDRAAQFLEKRACSLATRRAARQFR